MKLRVLDLFSGIGGFSLGLERTGGFETIAFCEYEAFPRAVLRKHWPDVPCFPDVRTLKGSDIEGPVDVICGGYPCQPFSTAGRRRGKEDDRHLWPEFSRLVAELRPTWVIGENVAGHISMGLDDVLSDLEGQGYACRTFVIPACAVGAVHRRDRLWVVANSNSRGRERLQCELGKSGQTRQGRSDYAPNSINDDVADAYVWGRQGSRWSVEQCNQAARSIGKADQPFNALGWPSQPPVRGRDDGVPASLDRNRLKALGNAVVPQVVQMIGHAILEAEAMR